MDRINKGGSLSQRSGRLPFITITWGFPDDELDVDHNGDMYSMPDRFEKAMEEKEECFESGLTLF